MFKTDIKKLPSITGEKYRISRTNINCAMGVIKPTKFLAHVDHCTLFIYLFIYLLIYLFIYSRSHWASESIIKHSPRI